jgi:hypothetical protein
MMKCVLEKKIYRCKDVEEVCLWNWRAASSVTSLLQCWWSNINIRCVRYFLPIHTVPSLTSFFEFRTISDGQMLECAESLETFLAKTWCFGNMRLSKIEVKPGSPPMLVIPWLLDSREFPGFAML